MELGEKRLLFAASRLACVLLATAAAGLALAALSTAHQPERWIFYPPPRSQAPVAFEPFRAVVAPERLLVGAAYNDLRLWALQDPILERAYHRTLADNFGLITAENACKPSTILPTETGPFNFGPCDRVLRFAEEHGMQFRLHVLAWGEWNPEWMVKLPPDEKPAALIKYARAVLTHYANSSIAFIDVVNEAVCDNVLMVPSKQNCGTGPGSLKAGQWVPSTPEYLDSLFKLARELIPSARLVYNEYGAESLADPLDSGKADRVFRTIQAALQRGVPIDAVGFQFHITSFHGGSGMVGSLLFSGWLAGVRANFERFATLGVAVHVTEIDVGCNYPTLSCSPFESTVAREESQAAVFAGVLDACLANRVCTVFQSWGFTDRFSWRDGNWQQQSAAERPTQKDELLDQKALMFTRDFSPKPAAFQILAKLKAVSDFTRP